MYLRVACSIFFFSFLVLPLSISIFSNFARSFCDISLSLYVQCFYTISLIHPFIGSCVSATIQRRSLTMQWIVCMRITRFYVEISSFVVCFLADFFFHSVLSLTHLLSSVPFSFVFVAVGARFVSIIVPPYNVKIAFVDFFLSCRPPRKYNVEL